MVTKNYLEGNGFWPSKMNLIFRNIGSLACHHGFLYQTGTVSLT